MTVRIHLDRMKAVGRGLILSIALSLVLLPEASWGASWTWDRTIHVDFENGDDSRDGLTRATARRTPPPPERIRPGDRILFKGGVRVKLSIEIAASGTADAPVIYDGNSRGEWGDGPAIIDGSGMFGPWTPAGTTADGLAIWETSPPRWLRWIDPPKIRVFQDGRLGRIASSADVDDNWADVNFDVYFQVPRAQATETSITYPELIGRMSDDWDGAALRIHHGNNHLEIFPVTGVDHETGRIRHARAPLIRRGNPKFAVVNHPDVFDEPGEILIRSDRILYVPFDAADPNEADVAAALFSRGFYNDSADHVVVRGFRLTMHRGWALRAGFQRKSWRGRGVVFEDNEVVDGGGIMVARQDEAVVRRNRVIRPLSRQPIFSYASDQLRLEDNEVRGGGTGITLYGTTNSLVLGNDSRRPRGVHGNALTVYNGSHNTWIIGNRLAARRGLTLRNSDDLIIAFNRIRSSRFAVAQWAPIDSGVKMYIFNNTLTGPVLLKERSAKISPFVNNAIERLAMKNTEAFAERTHNMYADFSHRTVLPENFRAGEMHLTLKQAFRSLSPDDMAPTEAGRTKLVHGRLIEFSGVSVSHVGAVGMDGRMPDLSTIGLPPADPKSDR